jgi:hypothetical protein
MARILAEKTGSSLRQVIHFAGVRGFGEAQHSIAHEWQIVAQCKAIGRVSSLLAIAKFGDQSAAPSGDLTGCSGSVPTQSH